MTRKRLIPPEVKKEPKPKKSKDSVLNKSIENSGDCPIDPCLNGELESKSVKSEPSIEYLYPNGLYVGTAAISEPSSSHEVKSSTVSTFLSTA